MEPIWFILAKEFNVGRFIYFQTALCYGVKPLQQPIRLDHPKFPANSSYAITKTANENFIEISGLDFVTFRLANVVVLEMLVDHCLFFIRESLKIKNVL